MQITTPWHVGPIDAKLTPFDTIHRKMGSTIACDVLCKLVSTSGCLDSFWTSTSRSFDTHQIQHSAARLRKFVDMNAQPCPGHMKWLAENGYTREDIRQIRYVVEVFHGLEPIFAILSALAEQWLSHMSFVDWDVDAQISSNTHSYYLGPIELVDGSDALSCAELIVSKFGKPVHAFYRALAVWPDYARKVFSEVVDECFLERVRLVEETAQHLSERIVHNPLGRLPALDRHELVESISRCSEISAWVIIMVASLRKGFILGEEIERDSRVIREGVGRAL